MYHQIIKAFTNIILTSTLLALTFSAVVQACSSKTRVVNQAIPTYDKRSDTVRVIPGSRDHAVIRFRRGAVVDEEENDGEELTTPSDFISNDEVFGELDLDFDDQVSVIEWSLEGGTVSDFWALLRKHDNDGDELISRAEFAPVHVRIRV